MGWYGHERGRIFIRPESRISTPLTALDRAVLPSRLTKQSQHHSGELGKEYATSPLPKIIIEQCPSILVQIPPLLLSVYDRCFCSSN